MKVDFSFKHLDTSQALMGYTEEKLGKIEKFELKPMEVHVVYSMQRHECMIEVTVLEGRRKFKATSVSHDFYRAVDNMVNKLSRQMSKDKKHLKYHKRPELSHYGQIEHLNPQLETHYEPKKIRKVG
jgi:putative sigma-54 modulation protein